MCNSEKGLQEPSQKSPRIAFVLKFYHIHTKYLLIFTYTHPQNALMIFDTRYYTWDFECCISIKTFSKVFVVPKEHPNIPLTVHPTSLCQLSARYLPVEYKKSPSLYQIQRKNSLQGSYRYYKKSRTFPFSIFKHWFGGGFQGLQLGQWFICLLALPQNK